MIGYKRQTIADKEKLWIPVEVQKAADMAYRPDRIVQRRLDLGISQDKLALTLKMDQAQLSRYESGATSPSPATLLKLADALECSTDYLLGRTEKPGLGDFLLPDERRALDLYRKRREEVIAAVVNKEIAKLPNPVRNAVLRIVARLQQDPGGFNEEGDQP